LVEHSDEIHGLPTLAGQRAVAQLLHSELDLLRSNEVALEELVVARRINRELDQFDVATLAHAALLRGRLHGVTIPPGGKVKFAVIASKGTVQHERVILLEELMSSHPRRERPNIEHYQALAIRAIWAILSPFGWDEEEVTTGHKRITLESFTA
jgi:DNA polymerase elongation subunit (family B)